MMIKIKSAPIALAALALPLGACSTLGGSDYGISDYALVRVKRVEEPRCVAGHFRQRGDVRARDRAAARHRFHDRHSEAFV